MKISDIGHSVVFHFLPDWCREAQWYLDIWSQNVVDDKAIMCKEPRSQNQPLEKRHPLVWAVSFFNLSKKQTAKILKFIC